MRTGAWITLITVLTVIVVILAYFVFVVPAPGTATGTATGGETTQPLSTRVIVTSPKADATVGKTFVVSGQAPGPWFFEASFPIKVIDKDGKVLLNTYASAQGEWMTTEQVTFTTNITLNNYTGPATLVLMRDNPSGLPENDDSVSLEIVIQ